VYLDACAIVSLIAREDTASAYAEALTEDGEAWTSTLAAWEAIIVLSRPGQLNCPLSKAERVVVEWLEERTIALREPARPHEVLALAVAVAGRHGLGKRALSNFDCFHYAYAKATGTPILTLDRLLRATDVETRP
jgi:ribonuclease VapC